MPKSRKERSKDYFETHKHDPEYKKRCKKNTQNYLSQPNKRKKYNDAAAERMRRFRQRKNEAAAIVRAIVAETSDPCSCAEHSEVYNEATTTHKHTMADNSELEIKVEPESDGEGRGAGDGQERLSPQDHSISAASSEKGSEEPMSPEPSVNFLDSAQDFKFDSLTTMEDLRQLSMQFIKERNWDQFHSPRNVLLALVGEVGELAEIFQWKGEVSEGLPELSASEREHVGEELSDVLLYLIDLAVRCRVDLPKAVKSKMAANAKKYPVSKAYGRANKYTDYEQS